MGGETFLNSNWILLRFNKIFIKAYVRQVFLNVGRNFISSGHYVLQVLKNYLQPCHIKCNSTTKFCYRKLQQSHGPWYCQKCIKQVLTFSELTYSQLNRITKGNFVSCPKKIIQEINLTFLDDENGASIKNDCLTPDEFYKELSNISPTSNFYLHMNISSLPYHFNDLKYLVENCQNKPKVIGITECRLKANRTVLSNIDLKDYTPLNGHLQQLQRVGLWYI